MIFKKIIYLFLIYFLVACSCKNNDKNAYIELYSSMLEMLKRYIAILEKIKIEQCISNKNEQEIIEIQEKIIKIQKNSEKFPLEMDNDIEIKEKLKNILIKIEIYNLYIISLQQKIKKINGANTIFEKLYKKSID